jgi:uncharacterized protein YacL
VAQIKSKWNPEILRFACLAGIASALFAFLLSWPLPLLIIYAFLFLGLGYEKNNGFGGVISSAAGQIIGMILAIALLSLLGITGARLALAKSGLALIMAFILISIAETISNETKKATL